MTGYETGLLRAIAYILLGVYHVLNNEPLTARNYVSQATRLICDKGV